MRADLGRRGRSNFSDHGPNALVTGIVDSAANASAAWLGLILTLTLLASALLSKSFFPIRAFQPDF